MAADQAKLVELPDWARAKLDVEQVGVVKVVLRLCRDARGIPSEVVLQRPKEWPELEAYYRAALSTWRYEPKVMGGVAIPLCAPVTFKYVLDRGQMPGETSTDLRDQNAALEVPRFVERVARAERWTRLNVILRACATGSGATSSITMEVPDEWPELEAHYQKVLAGIHWTGSAEHPGEPFCKGVRINYIFTR